MTKRNPHYSPRHYREIAALLLAQSPDSDPEELDECYIYWANTIRDFARLFADDNPRFNRDRFLSAAGLDF